MIHAESICPCVASDVDKVDIPPSAYRPDSEVRVEVSYAASTHQPCADDSCRSARLIY